MMDSIKNGVQWVEHERGHVATIGPGADHDNVLVSAYISTMNIAKDAQETQLKRLVVEQALVMQYAHLDAFLFDALILACVARPELLKSKRTLSWDMALAAGGWEKLVGYLAEQHAFEFSVKPLKARIAYLRDHHGLPLKLDQGLEKYVVFGEAVRNIVVHAGGTATAEFVRVTQMDTSVIGQVIELDEGHVERVTTAIGAVCGALAHDVASKILGASVDELIEAGLLARDLGMPKTATKAPSSGGGPPADEAT